LKLFAPALRKQPGARPRRRGSQAIFIIPLSPPQIKEVPLLSNWRIPRQNIVSTTVLLARRGTHIEEAAEHLARLHYQGKSIPHAVGHLIRDAMSLFMEKHGCWTEEDDRINEMAGQLESEGWKVIYNGSGYLWRHSSRHVDVNNRGGTFDTYTIATRRAYESQTRKLLLEATNE
jgi:hypothetical protein